jgi:hypothetical protein
MAGTAPLKSLNAVTAPGNGTTFDVQRATSNWEVQITTTGAPASFAAHLEGAIDGSTLVTIGSSITATGLTNVTSNTPLTQVRLVLDSLTGGTAPTLTGVIVGDGPAGTSGGGGGGAATIADGADVAEGAKADAAATTDTGTFSLIALFKRLLQKFTTQFPAALGGTTAANSFPVTLASDGTYATLNGAVTEAAPATDTASSGLNGRLQRIAQRLTSLIAQVPAALTGSGNLKTAIVESTATVTTTGAGGTFPVTNANLDAALSTLVPTTDFDTKVGSLTETAPATDTASSGLNGRLQRVAQRITSLIALLPSALISNRLDVNLGAAPATVSVQGGAAVGAATVAPVVIGLSDGGGNTRNVQSFASNGLALANTVAAGKMSFNGASADADRNNIDVTLLSSASRSTTQSPANITTYNAGAIKVIVDTTVLPGAAISNVVTINEVDPASGKSILLLTGVAIVGVSTNEYTVDPMIPAVANVTAQKRVPRTINVVITSGNGNSATYSVGYMLLPA